jgi:hypothetical protein
MKAILTVRCYKSNGHKAWIALRDAGSNYDILMGVIQTNGLEGEPSVTIKPNGKPISTLVEAMVDFKARCNFYAENGWTVDTVFQKLLDGLIT